MKERKKIVNFYNKELRYINNITLPYEKVKVFLSNFSFYM